MFRSSTAVHHFVLAGLVLAAMASSAPAAEPDVDTEPTKVRNSVILQQIASKLEAENAQCSVELTYTGRLTTQRMEMPSHFDSALVVVYTVEGCNGGNNWLAAAQVYGLKDETFRELGDAQTWAIVQGVSFSNASALIRALNQGPEDGHCCPTDGRTVEVTMLGDQPVFRQVETWKPGN